VTKYSGLMIVAYRDHELEKRALLDEWGQWSEANPWTSMGMSFIPGVGAVASGMDALNDFKHGRILAGIGNTIWTGANLVFPFGGLARVARTGLGAARGLRGARAAGKSIRPANSLRGIRDAWRTAKTPSAITAAPATFGQHAGNKIEQLEHLGRSVGGKGMAAGMGLSLGAPFVEGRGFNPEAENA